MFHISSYFVTILILVILVGHLSDLCITNILYQYLVSSLLSVFVSCVRNLCLLQGHKYVLLSFLCTCMTVIYDKLIFVYDMN